MLYNFVQNGSVHQTLWTLPLILLLLFVYLFYSLKYDVRCCHVAKLGVIVPDSWAVYTIVELSTRYILTDGNGVAILRYCYGECTRCVLLEVDIRAEELELEVVDD